MTRVKGVGVLFFFFFPLQKQLGNSVDERVRPPAAAAAAECGCLCLRQAAGMKVGEGRGGEFCRLKDPAGSGRHCSARSLFPPIFHCPVFLFLHRHKYQL